jgi:hypothetical protein
MLAAIRAGRVQAVLAWHTDRLHRSPVKLEEYISACNEDRDVPTHTVQAGPRPFGYKPDGVTAEGGVRPGDYAVGDSPRDGKMLSLLPDDHLMGKRGVVMRYPWVWCRTIISRGGSGVCRAWWRTWCPAGCGSGSASSAAP